MTQTEDINAIKLGGVFNCQIIRAGVVIDKWTEKNLVVNEGINHILNTEFTGTTQVTQWYLSLFEGNYTPVADVTAATIVAASTECTAYDEATRVAFVEAPSTAKSITNLANKGTFTMNATKTVYGAFLISSAAKLAATGTLFAAARFATARVLQDDDQILIGYTINGSAA